MKTLTTYRIIDKTIRLFFILSFFLRWSNKEGGSLEIGIKKKSEVERPMKTIMESLILAQNERWRRVLNMQVER